MDRTHPGAWQFQTSLFFLRFVSFFVSPGSLRIEWSWLQSTWVLFELGAEPPPPRSKVQNSRSIFQVKLSSLILHPSRVPHPFLLANAGWTLIDSLVSVSQLRPESSVRKKITDKPQRFQSGGARSPSGPRLSGRIRPLEFFVSAPVCAKRSAGVPACCIADILVG